MKIDNTKNKKDNTKTTNTSDKVQNGGAGDAKNGLKLTNVLKTSSEVSGPLKTMGAALHTSLTLPTGLLESAV